MKKLLFVAVMLAGLASAHAQLVWEKTEIELRPKAGDEDAIAQFKYTNKGDKPVRITNVKASCGCTVPEWTKEPVAPGESGQLTATFKIGNRTGQQVKTVRVDTDDASPPANLVLKAVIPQGVQIQPAFVFWQMGEATKPKTITVRGSAESPVSKVDVSSSTSDFTTKVEKGATPGEFLVHVQPTSTEKQLNGVISIKPADSAKTFQVLARVTGAAAAGMR